MPNDDVAERFVARGFSETEFPGLDVTGLARASVAAGRQRARRRRAWVAGGICAGAVGVLATAAMASTILREGGTPAGDSPDQALTVEAWVDRLPQAENGSSRVPLLNGTDLHLGSGRTIQLEGGDGAELIGTTDHGTVILLSTREGPSQGSAYWFIDNDGAKTWLADGTTAEAQGALVSPDGRFFTDGARIYDLREDAIWGAIPVEAEVLYAWSSAGIVFGNSNRATYLWSLESDQPIKLDGHPGQYDASSDTFVAGEDGCPVAQRLTADGVVSPVADGCTPNLLTVSANGDVVTKDLHFISGDRTGNFAPAVISKNTRWDSYWVSDHEVVITMTEFADYALPGRGFAVICSLKTADCLRWMEPVDVDPNAGRLELP